MPVTINGTTGISGSDGSVSAPSVRGNDSDTGLYFPSAGNTAIAINGNTALLIDNNYNITTNGNISMASSFKRNRIINGNMLIDQRNAGASVTANTTGATVYTIDRWAYYASQASKFTVQQNAGSVTPPSGFKNYLGVTSSAATTVGSGDIFLVRQGIEGFNIADLDWGTASAKTITLSFWVRSSLTGTFSGSLSNDAANRGYAFTYSISSANSWEYKTVTITGETTGTWLSTNGAGVYVGFSLGTGSTYSGTANSWVSSGYINGNSSAVNMVGTNGATFYVTGVQLEVGTKATPYEMQIYSDQLAQCQRYLPVLQPNSGGTTYIPSAIATSASAFQAYYVFKVTPRVPPTGITATTASGFSYNDTSAAAAATGLSFIIANYDACLIGGSVSGGLTQFRPGALQLSSTSQIQFTGCEI